MRMAVVMGMRVVVVWLVTVVVPASIYPVLALFSLPFRVLLRRIRSALRGGSHGCGPGVLVSRKSVTSSVA